MTVAIQRWLSVRLDLFGNILILGIALFAAGFRTSVNPSKIGVVLSYSLSSESIHHATQPVPSLILHVNSYGNFLFVLSCFLSTLHHLILRCLIAQMVSQFAQNEQNMNAVERVLVYVDLPREGKTIGPATTRPSWPEKGEVRFKDVHLAYREGLPLVLKGVSFEVKEGEKVCVIFCVPQKSA